jgi:hypothetical protein
MVSPTGPGMLFEQVEGVWLRAATAEMFLVIQELFAPEFQTKRTPKGTFERSGRRKMSF